MEHILASSFMFPSKQVKRPVSPWLLAPAVNRIRDRVLGDLPSLRLKSEVRGQVGLGMSPTGNVPGHLSFHGSRLAFVCLEAFGTFVSVAQGPLGWCLAL